MLLAAAAVAAGCARRPLAAAPEVAKGSWVAYSADAAPSEVRGSAVSRETWAPIRYGYVIAESHGLRRTTAVDTAGRFRLALAPGRWRVRATIMGFAPQTLDVRVDGERGYAVRFALTPWPEEMRNVRTVASSSSRPMRAAGSTVSDPPIPDPSNPRR